jgi:hypothetical protein
LPPFLVFALTCPDLAIRAHRPNHPFEARQALEIVLILLFVALMIDALTGLAVVVPSLADTIGAL